MLILSRKKNQSIILGNDIEITVVAIEGDQVKIGINAPKHVEILRKEIYLSIQEENKRAANQSISIDTLQKIIMKKAD
ncbi:carbon storage regulator [Vulcanibacillus modesticaldus]|uniref:Translational regulator CsrA n=1 Tax=Vulcanibacillus modesticaldus TaxID=337097 RepID=A0A1D2YUW4_9BACI|nr:carbon storage regulator CsrA [Vulcanibacillus modesticaldus]OEF99498.1 carbon storage regulator [Vulcanibacillus modesticaldus]